MPRKSLQNRGREKAAERAMKSQRRYILGGERGQEDEVAGEGERQGEGKVAEVKDKE